MKRLCVQVDAMSGTIACSFAVVSLSFPCAKSHVSGMDVETGGGGGALQKVGRRASCHGSVAGHSSSLDFVGCRRVTSSCAQDVHNFVHVAETNARTRKQHAHTRLKPTTTTTTHYSSIEN